MKRGFLNNPSNSNNEGLLRDQRSSWSRRRTPFGSQDASDRLGSASGVPSTCRIENMPGVSWSEPCQQWGRRPPPPPRVSMPWKTTTNEPLSKDSMEDDTIAATTEESSKDAMEDDTTAIATMRSAQASEFSSLTLTTASAPVAQVPFLPHKTTGVPKCALDNWYVKEHRAQIRNDDCYFCWPNDGLPHERKFTCVFLCPATGELFPAGKYGPSKHYAVTVDPHTAAQVVWYNDKASAQHGAASRAYDCLSMRKYTPMGMQSVHLGDETPYLTAVDAPAFPSLPDTVKNRVEIQRRLIANRNSQISSTTTAVAPKQALASWYIKAPRSHQLSKGNYVSWRDSAMPHIVKYTSVFVCPLSGEVFCSGRHGNTETYEERQDSAGNTVYWFNKKVWAEHAAAARAYDCWCYRLEGRTADFLGQDAPYKSPSEEAQPPLPLPRMPSEASAQLKKLIKEASLRSIAPLQPPPLLLPMPTEAESLADRDKYRSARWMMDPSAAMMNDDDDPTLL